jgi:hypothetical protein
VPALSNTDSHLSNRVVVPLVVHFRLFRRAADCTTVRNKAPAPWMMVFSIALLRRHSRRKHYLWAQYMRDPPRPRIHLTSFKFASSTPLSTAAPQNGEPALGSHIVLAPRRSPGSTNRHNEGSSTSSTCSAPCLGLHQLASGTRRPQACCIGELNPSLFMGLTHDKISAVSLGTSDYGHHHSLCMLLVELGWTSLLR